MENSGIFYTFISTFFLQNMCLNSILPRIILRLVVITETALSILQRNQYHDLPSGKIYSNNLLVCTTRLVRRSDALFPRASD
jgi:hypothetical protein